MNTRVKIISAVGKAELTIEQLNVEIEQVVSDYKQSNPRGWLDSLESRWELIMLDIAQKWGYFMDIVTDTDGRILFQLQNF